MTSLEEKYQKRRLRKSYITAVISISLVLFLLGLQGLILIHANKLSRYVRENIGFTVVLNDLVKDADIARLQKTLDVSPFVKRTQYISKADAAKQLTQDLGDDFVDFIGYNPLSASLEVRLHANYANVDSMAVLEKQLAKNPVVKEIYYQKNLVQTINDNIRRISYVLLGVSVIILLIAVTLINNTIRLSIYAKRLLIKSMQLVGATQGFIGRPFIRKGLSQGFVGALVANLLVFSALYFLISHVPELVTLQDIDWFLLLFVAIFALGTLLAWLSSYFAVRRFIRMNSDDIHF